MSTNITTVSGKGAPLNSTEFDNNFISLKNASDEAVNKLASIENGIIKAGEAVNAETAQNAANAEKLAGMLPGNGADSILHTDENGNLGIGDAPKNWGSNISAVEVGSLSLGGYKGDTYGNSYLFDNGYIDESGNVRYKKSDSLSYYFMGNGLHRFYSAPSGSAGDIATLTEHMRIAENGYVGVGKAPEYKLDISDKDKTAVFNPDDESTWVTQQIYSEASVDNTGRGIKFGNLNTTKGAGIAGVAKNTTGGRVELSLMTSTGNHSYERMRIDEYGNVGIGKEPSAYHSSHTGLGVKGMNIFGKDHYGYIGSNIFLNSSGAWEYEKYAPCSLITFANGRFTFRTGGTGVAGATPILNESFIIEHNKKVCIARSDSDALAPIVESGSNSNGEYTKFADGTLVCWKNFSGITSTTPIDYAYRSVAQTWTFPYAFKNLPSISGTCNQTNGNLSDIGRTTTTCTFYVSGSRAHTSRNAHVLAVGRWY